MNNPAAIGNLIPMNGSTALSNLTRHVTPDSLAASNGLPSPYTPLSGPRAFIVGAILVVMTIIVILTLYRTMRLHQHLKRVRGYVDRSISLIPPAYNSRPLMEALIPRYFEVPNNFLDLPSEPNFTVTRLSWFLGLLDVLSPNANLSYGDLPADAHPGRRSSIMSPEFWLDFEYDGRRWVIWFPDDNGFEIALHQTFSKHDVIIRSRRSRAEIMAWLERQGIRKPRPSASSAPQPDTAP